MKSLTQGNRWQQTEEPHPTQQDIQEPHPTHQNRGKKGRCFERWWKAWEWEKEEALMLSLSTEDLREQERENVSISPFFSPFKTWVLPKTDPDPLQLKKLGFWLKPSPDWGKFCNGLNALPRSHSHQSTEEYFNGLNALPRSHSHQSTEEYFWNARSHNLIQWLPILRTLDMHIDVHVYSMSDIVTITSWRNNLTNYTSFVMAIITKLTTYYLVT